MGLQRGDGHLVEKYENTISNETASKGKDSFVREKGKAFRSEFSSERRTPAPWKEIRVDSLPKVPASREKVTEPEEPEAYGPIVRVSEIERVRGRIRVRMDDGSSYTILKSMLRERPLEVNQALDGAEYARWVARKQYASAMEKAVGMLAVRARSREEIRQGLNRIGYAPGTVERVMGRLEQAKLLDDTEFAQAWAQSRAARKYGPRRIAMELRQKGIDGETAAAVLENLDTDEQEESALALAKKALGRAKAGEDPRKTRQRVIDSLVRRGYGWEAAKRACDRVMTEEEEDD